MLEPAEDSSGEKGGVRISENSSSVSSPRAWLVVHKCASGPAAGELPGNLIRDSNSQIPLRPIESEALGWGP